MHFHHSGRGALDSFEQEIQRHAAERLQTEQPERVHKRPQVRLPVEKAVKKGVGLMYGGHRIAVPGNQGLGGVKPVGKDRINGSVK